MASKIALETWPPYVFSNNTLISSEDINNERLLSIDKKSLKLNETRFKKVEIRAPHEWYEIKIKQRWKQILPQGSELLITNKGQIKPIKIENIITLNGDIWIATYKSLPNNIFNYNSDVEKYYHMFVTLLVMDIEEGVVKFFFP